ncbi:MAG TPA: TonB family protein, partial [Candidatus Binatia bacterium]|nr:TonB family protein [Candidatus Binatia bacterium]
RVVHRVGVISNKGELKLSDPISARRWFASLTASATIYVALAVVAVVLAPATGRIVREKAVELKFVEKIAPPPPPRPAPVEVKPLPPAAAAPVVRPDQKIRKLEQPPPPKQMVAPKEMPTEAPREADPSEDKGVAVYGEGKGDPAGLEGGTAGGVVGGQVGGAIALPEDAIPPVPATANRIPAYPQEARASGRTGTVVLKVVILADGRVADVQVLRGEEPFVAAALETVKTWHYAPARYKGQAITVYRIIQIPFKLTA